MDERDTGVGRRAAIPHFRPPGAVLWLNPCLEPCAGNVALARIQLRSVLPAIRSLGVP